jgi:hypothetical protein
MCTALPDLFICTEKEKIHRLENSQLRSRVGDFNYTIILCAGAPLPPIVSKQS